MRLFALSAVLFSTPVLAAETGVKVDQQGVAVSAPGTEIKVDADGVTIGVAGVDVDVSGANTSATNVRAINKADQPFATELKDISVAYGTKNYTCAAGQSIAIDGTGSMYTVRGDCDSVSVSGIGNTVNLDGVRFIRADGTGHSITWQRSIVGPAPIGEVGGTGHSIARK